MEVDDQDPLEAWAAAADGDGGGGAATQPLDAGLLRLMDAVLLDVLRDDEDPGSHAVASRRAATAEALAAALRGAAAAGAAAAAARAVAARCRSALERVCLPRFWAAAGGPPAALVAPLRRLAAGVEGLSRLLCATRDVLLGSGAPLSAPDHVALRALEPGFARHAAAAALAPPPRGGGGGLRRALRAFFGARLDELAAALEEGEEPAPYGSYGLGDNAGDDEGDSDDSDAAADLERDSQRLPEAWLDDVAAVRHAAALLLRDGAALDAAFARAVAAHLRRRVREAAAEGGFETAIVPWALARATRAPLHLARALAPARFDAAAWRGRLAAAVHAAAGELRAGELFDAVVEWPESAPAVADLAACLAAAPRLRPRLAAAFGAAVRARLLHPGAATGDIITHYVSAIRALGRADPSGLVLDAVGRPIREYLRTRRDTTRCVVQLLSDDDGGGGGGAGVGAGGASLLAELGAAEAGAAARARRRGGADLEGAGAGAAALAEADAWEPDPPEARPFGAYGGPAGGGAAAGGGGADADAGASSGDAVSLLVGIYGGRELFVAEYRSMLAARLLARPGYEAERETRTLELLKVRFGEGALAGPEVMLRDLAESRRLDALVKSTPDAAATPPGGRGRGGAGAGGRAAAPPLAPVDRLSATVVSALFWPPPPAGEGEGEGLAPPPEVAPALEAYAAKYAALKAPRVLRWRPAAGAVALSVRVGASPPLELWVTPPQAAAALALGRRAEWALPELAAEMGAPPEAARRAALFWVNRGVASEVRDAAGRGTGFRRNEALAAPAGGGAGGAAGAAGAAADDGADDDDGDGGGPPASQGGAAGGAGGAGEMARFEPYVLGMLSNFDALPLDRIHNMLKMFVAEPPYDRTVEQLGAYLGRLVAAETLALEGGLYKRRAA